MIETVLVRVLHTKRLEDTTRTIISGLLKLVRDTETIEGKKAALAEDQLEAGTICKLFKHDLRKIYDALSGQLNDILDAASATLKGTNKL
jgi:hypothetical protein